ncbi:MAG: hypothetical protein IJS65_06595 [Clostridia bacterium]|nr:hypothetical protein [Clostridia bacterium]
MEALEKAKSVDKGSTNENIDLAIKLFEVAANGHNAYAERRLGALNAISYGKPGFDSAFNNAVGYFTMAIEDGDAAYSYEMAEALTEKLDDGQLLLNKPHKLALAAYNGSSYYRILLSVYYWKILNKPQRTLESLYNWALNGDYVTLFNLADVLFALDDEEYKKKPG